MGTTKAPSLVHQNALADRITFNYIDVPGTKNGILECSYMYSVGNLPLSIFA